MIATKKPVASSTVRVAIYARVSVADGLEKEFNSIDAQREAVGAYIQSQRGSGWVALPERYEDGGYTGANIERPAFQRLLADVKAGKLDVIAVYKIDRLSRSLLDFSQLFDLFQRHGVAFVSVTQSFDTSTPMGRMVVNLLATFAQFERETTAERVRDKVLATRRRGMWTGGRVPLGYDLVEKKLVVNAAEAERVRAIFALYQELGSLLSVVHELNARGWTTKPWTTKSGKREPGRLFCKTTLHLLLTNPLYLGKIRAGDELADGQHEAIVDQATWDTTQAQLSIKSARKRGWRPPKRDGPVLRGILFCACGAAMIRHSTHRHGRVYYAYVCNRALKEGAAACPRSRANMGELEAFVVDQIRAMGRDPGVLEATLAADRAARDVKRSELEAGLRKLSELRGRVEANRRNVVAAVEKGADSLVGRVSELDAELAEADLRVQEVRRDLSALDLDAIDPVELKNALREFDPVWAELNTPERARVLALLIERITFDARPGDVEIRLRPGGPRLLTKETS